MRAHVLVLGFTAAVAAASLVPGTARAQAGTPPTFHYSIREVVTAPPLVATSPEPPAPPPPRYDLLWSSVLEEAASSLHALTDVSARELSALLEPGPIDTPAQPGAFAPDSAPPEEAPAGLALGTHVRLQPVAIISPVPLGTEIRGEQAVLPCAVMQMPWMIP